MLQYMPNAELIALHVIHSEIKNVYSTYYGGSVNQSSIRGQSHN
jgi:hypothetical protein